MKHNQQQYTYFSRPEDAPPQPPVGYHSPDDVDYDDFQQDAQGSEQGFSAKGFNKPSPQEASNPSAWDSEDDSSWGDKSDSSWDDEASSWADEGDSSWGAGADSADDVEEDPWAGARPSSIRPTYEYNRRNPDAGLGITTKTKAGWIALGFFLGIFSPIIIFLLYQNREPELRMAAFRYVMFGLLLGIIAELMLLSAMGAMDIASSGSAASEASSWTSTNF